VTKQKHEKYGASKQELRVHLGILPVAVLFAI
jgi:hypothetical protein